MNLPAGLSLWVEILRPHALSWLLCAARFAPVAFLCPIFGGGATPATVRLSLCLALAGYVRFVGDVAATVPDTATAYAAGFAHELLVGVAIGFVASLPFDAARMGGRLLDAQRGANAEAALPGIGSKESATGDLLFQLLVALVFACGAYKPMLGGAIKSFKAVPAGVWAGWDGGALVESAVAHAGGALAAGFAIGAPAAAVSLAVDAALGVAARVSPQINLGDTGAPAKLMLGAAGILFCFGAACERLLSELDVAINAAYATIVAAFG